jgi:TolB protein
MKRSIIVIMLLAAAAVAAAVMGCSKDGQAKTPISPSADTTNHAPAVPNTPSPADNATGQATLLYLQWQCYDQDAGDAVTYSIDYGPGNLSNNIPGIAGETVLLQNLSTNTNYTWRVTATDNHGASSTGPIWHFKTQ